MRISDWSSDVCSSDLREGVSEDGDDFLGGEEAVAAVAGALAQNAGSGEGIERTGRGLERDVQFRCQHLGRQDGLADDQLQGPRAGDRTSAVSGKGGSVRVDLGERHSIQKKKKK